MDLKSKNIYTDLFFTKPTEILNLIDELEHFDNQSSHVWTYTSNNSPYEYRVPISINRKILSQIFDIDKYIDNYFDEKDRRLIIEERESIDLSALFNEMDNYFHITIKVDKDEKFMLYCSEDDFSTLFKITESNII